MADFLTKASRKLMLYNKILIYNLSPELRVCKVPSPAHEGIYTYLCILTATTQAHWFAKPPSPRRSRLYRWAPGMALRPPYFHPSVWQDSLNHFLRTKHHDSTWNISADSSTHPAGCFVACLLSLHGSIAGTSLRFPWGSLSAQTAGLPSYKWEEMESEEVEMQKEYCTWITNLLLPTGTEPISYPPNQQPHKTGIDETMVCP